MRRPTSPSGTVSPATTIKVLVLCSLDFFLLMHVLMLLIRNCIGGKVNGDDDDFIFYIFRNKLSKPLPFSSFIQNVRALLL